MEGSGPVVGMGIFRGGGAKGDNLGGGGDKKKGRGGRKAIMLRVVWLEDNSGRDVERVRERKKGYVGIIVEIREEEELMLRLCKGWLPNNLSA